MWTDVRGTRRMVTWRCQRGHGRGEVGIAGGTRRRTPALDAAHREALSLALMRGRGLRLDLLQGATPDSCSMSTWRDESFSHLCPEGLETVYLSLVLHLACKAGLRFVPSPLILIAGYRYPPPAFYGGVDSFIYSAVLPSLGVTCAKTVVPAM